MLQLSATALEKTKRRLSGLNPFLLLTLICMALQVVPPADAEVPQVRIEPDADPSLPPPFPIGNKVSRTVQRVTGVNWLSGVVASQVASHVLKHKVGGRVKVKVATYSLTDLIAGKVKRVDVSLTNSHVEGVELGTFKVHTKNPVWYSPFKRKDKRKDKRRGLNNPVNLSVVSRLNQSDVAKALASQEITSKIRGLKLDLPGLADQELEVLKPTVDIENELVIIKGTLVTRGASEDTGVPLTIQATPKLVAYDQIVLENLKVESPYIVEPEKFSAFISDLLNPIVRFSRYDRKTHAFRLYTLNVDDDVVDSEGNLLIVPKDYKPQVAKKDASM